MQSAAGGTSQRLKPAVAIVRSLSRMPGAPDGANVVSAVVIGIRLPVRDLDGPRFSKIRGHWMERRQLPLPPSNQRRFDHVHQPARRARPIGTLIDGGLSGD